MHTGVRHWLLAILVFVIALGLASAVFLLAEPHTAIAPPAVTSGNGMYTNQTYGYSFSYPTQYSVNPYTPSQIAVGTPTVGGGFNAVANLDFITPDVEGGYANYEALVDGTAANDCAADGPSASISCTGVATSSAYTTASGVTGEVFYLTQVTRTLSTGATATTERGPFYAFDMSANFPSEQYAALLVHVPIAGSDSANASVVTSIAHSLTLPTPPAGTVATSSATQ